jgi:hypothetical protein
MLVVRSNVGLGAIGSDVGFGGTEREKEKEMGRYRIRACLRRGVHAEEGTGKTECGMRGEVCTLCCSDGHADRR